MEYILNLIPRTLQRFTGVHARLREVVESHENQVSRELFVEKYNEYVRKKMFCFSQLLYITAARIK